MSDWVLVANKADIEEGKCATADVDGVQVAVFNVMGNFYAVEDNCSHDGIEFCESAEVEGLTVTCPWHGARFSLETGAVEAPPAYEPLALLPMRIADNGDIEVRDDRWD